MRSPIENRKNHSQILVFLIVFFAVIVAMGVSFLYSGRSRTNIIKVQMNKKQTERASRSGLEIGRRKLLEDSCSAGWSGTSLTIGGAQVNITVTEEAGEYNLTSSATKGKVHFAISDSLPKSEMASFFKAYGSASDELFTVFKQTLDGGYIIDIL